MVTATPVFPQTPRNGKFQIANATGTAFSTLYTGGSNGSKIHGIILTSTDTSAHDIQIALTRGGTNYIIGTVSVPANSGNNSSNASVNGLSTTVLVGLPLDSDGNPELLLLDANDTLTVAAPVAVTSGKFVNAVCFGADF